MKSKNRTKCFIGLLLFFISLIVNNNIVNNDLENIKKPLLKNNSSWDLTGTPISIDGNAEWVTTAATEPWCNGSGTWSDPYIIENVTIDGQDSGNCIEISNSNVYFILRNNTLYNSGSGSNDAGIFLYRTDNGQLINNTITLNGYYGIYLDDSNNNSIIGNSVTANVEVGIGLYNSDYNSVWFNIINNNDRGIKLEISDYNHIFENNLSNNNGFGFLSSGLIILQEIPQIVMELYFF